MKSDVVICTAQVLINAMRKKDISIEDISLLIMDECHHTGNHRLGVYCMWTCMGESGY